MHCESCGARTSPGARFCAACGAPIAARGPGGDAPAGSPPPAAPEAPRHPLPGPITINNLPGAMISMPGATGPVLPPGPWSASNAAWGGSRGPFCPHCRQRTVPVPYFSRGFNLAKAAGLVVFSPIAPLLFFLIRRDRALCSWCKSILPGEIDVPLLDTFSATPLGLTGSELILGEGAHGEALIRQGETAEHEIALHETKSRRSRRRASTMGAAALLFTGIGGFVAADAGVEAATFLFSMGGLTGIGAFASRSRGKRHGLAAQAKRQRQRVLEILSLARSQAGKLTVTTVAGHMRLDLQEAEALLDSMVDGRRVDVHVDDAGRLTYVFPELTA